MMRDDAVYRGYSPGELERLYSHRHRIEGYDDYLERWPRESAAAREHLATVADVAYGSRAAESYDVFPAGPGAPVLVFFHGGYWFSQDKGNFEFMAPAFVARGTTFVSANYPLCPEVTLPEIVDACRRCMMHVRDNAQTWGADPERVYVSGHSAGGHITACVMSTQWTNLRPGTPGDLVRGGVAISGVYDVEPIRFVEMNDTLRIDAATARDCLAPAFGSADRRPDGPCSRHRRGRRVQPPAGGLRPGVARSPPLVPGNGAAGREPLLDHGLLRARGIGAVRGGLRPDGGVTATPCSELQ